MCRRCWHWAIKRNLQNNTTKTNQIEAENITHFPRLTEELFTIRDWLRFTVSQFEEAEIFFGHGTDNSYDEAVWLVMSALHLPHDTLINFLDAVITEQERKHLAHLI